MESPAIEDGAVAVKGGAIAGFGQSAHILKLYRGEVLDFGDAILMPGLVNAHTHLELSALAGEVEAGGCFVDWVAQVVEKRQNIPQAQVEAAIARQVRELRETGTALLGDVTNTGLSRCFLTGSGLRATIFHEVIGFRDEDADEIFSRCLKNTGWVTDSPLSPHVEDGWLRSTLAPHGPHSVSPRLLQKVLAHNESTGGISAIHLAESYEEDLLIRGGNGPFRGFLVKRGVWDSSWRSCPDGPVSYLDGLGFLRPGTLCVHLVHASEEDLQLLARRGVAACICPRSNQRTRVGRAPVEAMLKVGLPVALGTDSLASNDDLNVLAEAQHLHRESPGVPPQEIVRMLTLNGALALRWSQMGSIAHGKVGRLALAPVSDGSCRDPYEYLLERVGPREVKAVDASGEGKGLF